MPGIVCTEDGFTRTNMDFSTLEELKAATRLKTSSCFGTEQVCTDSWVPVLPGLPDDVSKHCLALVPRDNFPTMGGVCKKWTSFFGSKEFITIHKLAGLQEEWLYVLTKDAEGHEARWDVLDGSGNVRLTLPPMPGPKKAGFGIAVLSGKLLIVGGFSVIDCNRTVSADVYQYDSCLNRWSKLASMNTPRHDFACTAVNGVVYVVGGYGADAEGLSSAEAYNTDSDTWTPNRKPTTSSVGLLCLWTGRKVVLYGRKVNLLNWKFQRRQLVRSRDTKLA